MAVSAPTSQQLGGAGFMWPDATNLPAQAFNGPSLAPYLGDMTGTITGVDPLTDPSYQAALAAVRQYDPQASYVGGLAGDNNTPTYQMYLDPSKLPNVNNSAAMGRGPLAGRSGETAFEPPFVTTPTAPGALINPALTYSSGTYGNVTPNANVRQIPNTGLFGIADKLLPYAVMSVLGYGAGAAGSSLLASAGLGGTVGSSLGNTLGNFALNDFMSGGNAKFNPLSLLGAGGAALGLPSWVPSAAATLASVAQGGRLQFNPYALAAHYAPYLFGGGGGGG